MNKRLFPANIQQRMPSVFSGDFEHCKKCGQSIDEHWILWVLPNEVVSLDDHNMIMCSFETGEGAHGTWCRYVGLRTDEPDYMELSEFEELYA